MTPAERVEIALRGGHADKVPFTIYECMIPQCTVERNLRNRGLCILQRKPVFRTYQPNVKITQQTYWENGRQFIRTIHETPVGSVSTLVEPAGFTSWRHERMFKQPEDYKAILFLLQDERYEPAYEFFADAQQAAGPDAYFRAGIGLEPLQTLISGEIMGMEDFCIEWMDRRDEVLRLYEAIVENRRRIYPIVAASPASHANYGGNVVPEVIGLDTFRKYYVPHYNEAAEILHKHGKLTGCHYDANCKLLAEAINGTALDYIEAFTPAPDTDMTLREARAAWPDKVLWLNFPSSVHLRSDAEVERVTVDLLEQAGRPDGLINGHYRGHAAAALAGQLHSHHGRTGTACEGTREPLPLKRRVNRDGQDRQDGKEVAPGVVLYILWGAASSAAGAESRTAGRSIGGRPTCRHLFAFQGGMACNNATMAGHPRRGHRILLASTPANTAGVAPGVEILNSQSAWNCPSSLALTLRALHLV